MDYWLYLNDVPTDQLVDISRAAEAQGFRGVAVADHIAVPVDFDGTAHPSGDAPFDHASPFPDPLITAATILASTERIEVMSYVYILPMREPFSIAKQVGSLAVLSNDRFRLGVGAGWMLEEIALLGHPVARRGRRMDEMLDILGGFWRKDVFEYHGEFFDFGPTGVSPRPAKPVPIWVGGKSRAALERASRQDGWLGMNYGLEEIDGLLETLNELRREQEDVPRSSATSATSAYEVFVIPNAEPTTALHDDLSAKGVTGTMGFAWPAADPEFDSLEAKTDSLCQFADVFIRR